MLVIIATLAAALAGNAEVDIGAAHVDMLSTQPVAQAPRICWTASRSTPALHLEACIPAGHDELARIRAAASLSRDGWELYLLERGWLSAVSAMAQDAAAAQGLTQAAVMDLLHEADRREGLGMFPQL